MRIAMIAPPWVAVPPAAYGGTELVLDNLCRGLADAGHDVMLFATGDSTCPVTRAWVYDNAIGVDRAGPAVELHHVMDAYDAVADWGAEIVHDHTITGPVLAPSRHPMLPVVTTNHGPFERELAGVYRRIADRVPIIAISRHQAASAGDIQVAAVIHHGIDVDAVELGAGRGGYALFLGRMCPDKGVHRAAALARRAGIPLRIAAKMHEQAERAYFDEQVRPLLGGDVEYIGEVGGEAKQQLLADAYCLLNPIEWPEPFGMVMIESLAAGTPVVTTPHGAAPELIDDGSTGYLRADDDGLVDAIGAIAEIDRATCRSEAKARFTHHRMADDHLDLYRRVIG